MDIKEGLNKLERANYCNARSEDHPLLSIIIPVYNVRAYLRDCLLSVVNQTLDTSLYEIIIVDDKSTDGSTQIAEEFSLKHSNIRLIKLSKNTPGGAGIPSNIGIKSALGDYIGFVDSDDFVESHMFKEMLEKAISTDSEVVVCDFAIYHDGTNKVTLSYDKNQFKNLCSIVNLRSSLKKQREYLLSISPVPWRKFYKKSFLYKNSIQYPEGDFFFEDNPLHWFVSTLAEKIEVVDKVFVYHRMQRPGQTMQAGPKKLLAYAAHGITIKNFLIDHGIFDLYKNEFLIWILGHANWIIPKLGKNDRKLYLNKVGKIIKDVEISPMMYEKWGSYGVLRSIYVYIMYKHWQSLAVPMSKLYNFICRR